MERTRNRVKEKLTVIREIKERGGEKREEEAEREWGPGSECVLYMKDIIPYFL